MRTILPLTGCRSASLMVMSAIITAKARRKCLDERFQRREEKEEVEREATNIRTSQRYTTFHA